MSVKETTSTVGTGTITLLGAVPGFESFLAVVGNGNRCEYCIADAGGENVERGIGVYTAAGSTLSRASVVSSSNDDELVDFAVGTKTVELAQHVRFVVGDRPVNAIACAQRANHAVEVTTMPAYRVSCATHPASV